MSDNIIIGVHGQAQTLEGINGINAKETTGGSTNYVPEDTLKVGGKTVTQNGTYNAADDNMLGYKRVVVMDLASEGQTKAYQDTRKHNAMIACGGRQRVFSGVKKLCAKDTDDMNYIVVPSPVLRTKSLSVSHPGVYDVSSETDADVYTPVYVSVSDSERDAAGFNPDNPTWQDNLPDEIRVTTLPTKMEYSEGERIDYTGMVVKAYKNGSVWSNENYPGGVIPFNELILSEYAFPASEMSMSHFLTDDDTEWNSTVVNPITHEEIEVFRRLLRSHGAFSTQKTIEYNRSGLQNKWNKYNWSPYYSDDRPRTQNFSENKQIVSIQGRIFATFIDSPYDRNKNSYSQDIYASLISPYPMTVQCHIDSVAMVATGYGLDITSFDVNEGSGPSYPQDKTDTINPYRAYNQPCCFVYSGKRVYFNASYEPSSRVTPDDFQRNMYRYPSGYPGSPTNYRNIAPYNGHISEWISGFIISEGGSLSYDKLYDTIRGMLAWEMMYGVDEMKIGWYRPCDRKLLEAYFYYND